MVWSDDFIEGFINDGFLNWPNKWQRLLILRLYCSICSHWLKKGSCYWFYLVLPLGASMVLWCLFSLWRCYFQFTMCICPFYALLELLDWRVFNTWIEGDGERKRDIGQRAPWEAHQSFSWDPCDMRTEVLSTWFHTIRDSYGFKVEFYDVPEWPYNPQWARARWFPHPKNEG